MKQGAHGVIWVMVMENGGPDEEDPDEEDPELQQQMNLHSHMMNDLRLRLLWVLRGCLCLNYCKKGELSRAVRFISLKLPSSGFYVLISIKVGLQRKGILCANWFDIYPLTIFSKRKAVALVGRKVTRGVTPNSYEDQQGCGKPQNPLDARAERYRLSLSVVASLFDVVVSKYLDCHCRRRGRM